MDTFVSTFPVVILGNGYTGSYINQDAIRSSYILPESFIHLPLTSQPRYVR